MGTRALLSLAQFFALPDPENGSTFELDRGELLVMPPSLGIHELLKNRICYRLNAFAIGRGLGEAFCEAGFALDEDSWRRPDVCFVRAERLAQMRPDEGPLEGAPDLYIEIVSDSEVPKDLTAKDSAPPRSRSGYGLGSLSPSTGSASYRQLGRALAGTRRRADNSTSATWLRHPSEAAFREPYYFPSG
jgi:Uma2 family endonuclease